jgi:hypothetical protein
VKNLSRKDIPPCVWSAVETGFDSFLILEEKVDKVELVASEAHEVVGALLSANEQANEDKISGSSPDANKESMSGVSFLQNLSSTTIIDGKIHRPNKINQDNLKASPLSSNPNNNINPFPTVAHLFIFIFCSCFLPPTQNICHFPCTNY